MMNKVVERNKSLINISTLRLPIGLSIYHLTTQTNRSIIKHIK